MSRYIDADKIELSWYVPDVGYLADYQKRHNDMATYTQRVIDDAPTEDVAPVTHAHWIIGGPYEYNKDIRNIMYCSKCKAIFRYNGAKVNANYCYKCGARMDGEYEWQDT